MWKLQFAFKLAWPNAWAAKEQENTHKTPMLTSIADIVPRKESNMTGPIILFKPNKKFFRLQQQCINVWSWNDKIVSY